MDRFDHLLVGLREERSRGLISRDTGVSDRQLESAIEAVTGAAAWARVGQHRNAYVALLADTSSARESWSWVSPLTAELVSLAGTLHWMAEQEYAGAELLAAPPSQRLPVTRAAVWISAVLAGSAAVITTVVLLYRWGALASVGPAIATVVAMLILVVPVVWFGAQTRRRRGQLTDQLRDLARAIDQERRTTPGGRRSQASEDSLRLARTQVEGALRAVATGMETDGLDEIAQLVSTTRQWSRWSSLARAGRRLDKTTRRLSRSVRVTDHMAKVQDARNRPEDLREVRWWDRWLLRFPIFSLFAWMGAYGMHQNGWVTLRGSVIIFGVGAVIIAVIQGVQQWRGARLRSSTPLIGGSDQPA